MDIKIAREPLFIIKQLQAKGFEGYIVGGAVRDTLINSQGNYLVTTKDYDLTTNATPEEIQKIFPDNFYENKFGTVGIAKEHLHEMMGIEINNDKSSDSKDKVIDLNNLGKLHESLELPKIDKDKKEIKTKEILEVTTFRTDGEYKDYRKPETVVWGKTLKSDLDRRDFTINAMAFEFDPSFIDSLDFKQELILIKPSEYKIIDLHNGLEDLKNQVIKTVGNPDKRFNEDALRMLRAIRFSVQLNMQIENQTYESIIKNSHLVNHISWERIRDEFFKMLSSDYPKEAIEILDNTKLLSIILPELQEGKGVMQAGHHTDDVWSHNLNALDNCPSNNPLVRLATLIHDIAKPHTLRIINNKPTFYNHEVIGSRIAKEVGKRLKLSRDEINRLFILVRHHMFYYQPENSDASIRRFMRKVGLENINDILDLREADRLGSGARKTSWRLEEMKQRMIEQLHQPFSIKDLKVNGNDLMQELSIPAGRKIGEILNKLFEQVLENPELNNKEQLLKMAKEIS